MDDRHPDPLPVSADRDRELALLEAVQTELGDVEAALERIDDGTYGRCQVCGEVIDDSRLAADPTTRFCPEHLDGGQAHAQPTPSADSDA